MFACFLSFRIYFCVNCIDFTKCIPFESASWLNFFETFHLNASVEQMPFEGKYKNKNLIGIQNTKLFSQILFL